MNGNQSERKKRNNEGKDREGDKEGEGEEMTEEGVWEGIFGGGEEQKTSVAAQEEVLCVPCGENGLSQEEAMEEGGEEGRYAKGLPTPQKVTKEERQEHDRTHCPYRSWCKYCVRGRGQKAPHQSSKEKTEEEKEAEVPRISMDYFYMSKADEDAKENPLIVAVNEKTNDKYARAAGKKGVGEEGERNWLVKDLSDELKAWGHQGGTGGKISLKCDGEKSLVAFRDAVGKIMEEKLFRKKRRKVKANQMDELKKQERPREE